MAVHLEDGSSDAKDGTLSCCECAQVACEVDSYFYGNLIEARNKSSFAKWFREGDWYRYGGVAVIRDDGGEVLCEIRTRYSGLRFFFKSSHPQDAGFLLEWEQMFRHCRHNIVDPDQMSMLRSL